MGLIHLTGRGSRYLSIRCTEWLAEAPGELSVGSRIDSCVNALASVINGRHKMDVVDLLGSWKYCDGMQYLTVEWVGSLNNRQPRETTSYIPRA